MLSERLPVEQALTAVDGWGGDSMAAYDSDGVSCVAIDYRADTPADLAQMQRAPSPGWPRARRVRPASSRQGQTLVFRSCDPGKDATRVAKGSSKDAVALALTRTYLSLDLVKGGLDVPAARCGADRLVRTLSVAQLAAGDLDEQQVLRALVPCREDA